MRILQKQWKLEPTAKQSQFFEQSQDSDPVKTSAQETSKKWSKKRLDSWK